MVLKELIFTLDTLGVVVLKNSFLQFPLWKGVMVLKELNFNSFHFERVWWSSKN